jgi:hypothetical protein
MIGYLLICYVDTQRVSHNQDLVHQITDLVNEADIISSAYTLLFKNDNFDCTVLNFKEDVTDFLNDPIGMYCEEEEEDEEMDEFERNQKEQEMLDSGDEEFQYEKNYIPLYIHFVSSVDMFKVFCDYSNGLDIHNCEEFHCLTYDISCLDQMEILKKLQQPEGDDDLLKKIIKNKGEKHERFLRKLIERHQN